jgi:hypothetical protein
MTWFKGVFPVVLVLMALFWCAMVCCGVWRCSAPALGSCCRLVWWSAAQDWLHSVSIKPRLFYFVVVEVVNEAVGPVWCVLFMLGVSSFSFSREQSWSVNTSLSKAFRSRDFSPLRRRFVLLVLDLVVPRGCWLFLRLV